MANIGEPQRYHEIIPNVIPVPQEEPVPDPQVPDPDPVPDPCTPEQVPEEIPVG